LEGRGKEGRNAMMYYHFLESLRKNEYFVARDVAGEIRKAPGTPHYRALSEGELYNRVHQVIYHIYKRHYSFLNNGSTKNMLGTWYAKLGKDRFYEGFPLEEVVEVFSFIRRRVMRCVEERMHPEEDWSMKQASKTYWNVSLFFDAMTGAVIEGYQKESDQGTGADAC
jgi:hypothetical protein